MKTTILATALLAAASANATEEVKFGDLNFFVPASKFSLLTNVEFRSEEAKVAGVTEEQEGYQANALVTYGLSDNFNLFAGLSYLHDFETQSETSPANAHYDEDGFTSPLFGGIYRLASQNDSSFNFDLGAIGRFQVQDAERGSATGADSSDGNASSNGHSAEVFARVGKKWNEANEWQLTAGVTQNLEGEYEVKSAAGDTEFETDASTDFFARAAYQYRPVNEFMLSLAFQATQFGETTEESKTTGAEVDYNDHLDFDVDFVAKYLVTDTAIVRFNLGHGINRGFKGENAGVDFEIKQRKESRIGLGAELLF